jgi:hypothetical protein
MRSGRHPVLKSIFNTRQASLMQLPKSRCSAASSRDVASFGVDAPRVHLDQFVQLVVMCAAFHCSTSESEQPSSAIVDFFTLSIGLCSLLVSYRLPVNVHFRCVFNGRHLRAADRLRAESRVRGMPTLTSDSAQKSTRK